MVRSAVRPDPSLVADTHSDSVPSEGDIVSRMRAAIGLVDDLIERVEDYEIPKVVATVSTANSTGDRDSDTGRQRQTDKGGQSRAGPAPPPPTKPKIPNASRSAAGGNGTSLPHSHLSREPPEPSVALLFV